MKVYVSWGFAIVLTIAGYYYIEYKFDDIKTEMILLESCINSLVYFDDVEDIESSGTQV